MRINADFSERVIVRPEDYRWVDSPMPGVERMMLDRIGDEVARATSLVRYAPNSAFSSHVHGGGEEFFVLDGVFADEHREYPAGTYVRNPIGTEHTPRIGEQGCLIFVKLHQFDAGDTEPVVIDSNIAEWSPGPAPGIEQLSLHEYDAEHVALQRWAPNTQCSNQIHHGGRETLVLQGSFSDEHGEYPTGSWIRSPRGSAHTPFTKDDSALLYVKTGHLCTDPAT